MKFKLILASVLLVFFHIPVILFVINSESAVASMLFMYWINVPGIFLAIISNGFLFEIGNFGIEKVSNFQFVLIELFWLLLVYGLYRFGSQY